MTAEIMNWTGHVITGPRTKLPELVQRPECDRTGIYFLVGPDPENSLRPLVYIGETDNVNSGNRLKQAQPPRGQGWQGFLGKGMWLVTSKDPNLTKAHVKYLESLLIQIATEVGRCQLVQRHGPRVVDLPEADQADMAYFMDQIRTVLPVLGFDFLREGDGPRGPTPNQAQRGDRSSNRGCPDMASRRMRRKSTGNSMILEGSLARREWDIGASMAVTRACSSNSGEGWRSCRNRRQTQRRFG